MKTTTGSNGLLHNGVGIAAEDKLHALCYEVLQGLLPEADGLLLLQRGRDRAANQSADSQVMSIEPPLGF